MSQRRCLHSLTRHSSSLFSSFVKTTPHLHITISTPLHRAFHNLTSTIRPENVHFRSNVRCFSSGDSKDGVNGENSDDDEEDSEDDDEDEDGEIEDVDDDDDESVSKCPVKRVYSPEEKAKEAAEIGYEVIGPLQRSDRVYKDYEPAFAVVKIGSHQFKVSNGDCIYTERLKFCEVNDKLILNKVLLLGTSTQTVVGRPTLPEAAVHAVVEEHALDAKVIIFKKKRRKNYRRTKGHRQELTKLRITSVEGIEIPQKVVSEKPEKTSSAKSEKVSAKKPEKVPVAA